jgi:hypothetical protein
LKKTEVKTEVCISCRFSSIINSLESGVALYRGEHTKGAAMICNTCGKEIPDDSRLCPYCGISVDAQPLTDQSVPAQPSPPYVPPGQGQPTYAQIPAPGQPLPPYAPGDMSQPQPPYQQQPKKSRTWIIVLVIVAVLLCCIGPAVTGVILYGIGSSYVDSGTALYPDTAIPPDSGTSPDREYFYPPEDVQPSTSNGAVLTDNELVKITVGRAYMDEHWGVALETATVNKSDRTIFILFDAITVDGVRDDEVWPSGLEIYPGESLYDPIYFESLFEISELRNVEGIIEVYDWDSMETLGRFAFSLNGPVNEMTG